MQMRGLVRDLGFSLGEWHSHCTESGVPLRSTCGPRVCTCVCVCVCVHVSPLVSESLPIRRARIPMPSSLAIAQCVCMHVCTCVLRAGGSKTVSPRRMAEAKRAWCATAGNTVAAIVRSNCPEPLPTATLTVTCRRPEEGHKHGEGQEGF